MSPKCRKLADPIMSFILSVGISKFLHGNVIAYPVGMVLGSMAETEIDPLIKPISGNLNLYLKTKESCLFRATTDLTLWSVVARCGHNPNKKKKVNSILF